MEKIKISEIAKVINAMLENVSEDYAYGVSTDTRTLQKGDIYFALTGNFYDGHEFISVAQQKGACAIVCSKDIPCSLPILKVENTLKALQKLASYYRSKLSLKVVAVTGSTGKTTTKNMISTVLSKKYKVFSTDRNYNNEIGLPKSIFEIDNSFDVAVLELGMNSPGEISTLSKIAKPDVAVITNIGKAHMGNLGSLQNILKAKLEVLDGMKKGGTLILNSDDELLSKLKIEDFKIMLTGTNPFLSQLMAYDIEDSTPSLRFKVKYKDDMFYGILPTLGKHNVANALFAICCGLEFSISPASSLDRLKSYVPSPMRLETIQVGDVTIIKDYYNSSPDSAEAALKTLSTYQSKGKKIAILGQVLELGRFSPQEHYKLGLSCVLNKVDYAFFIGKDFEAFKNGMSDNSQCFDESKRKCLIEALKNYVLSGKVSAGDVILIKGSRNMKMEEFYEILKKYIESSKISNAICPVYSSSKLYVDINAVKFNYFQVKLAVGENVEVMPMVKANAYGAGAEIISNVFQNSKYLAVADVREANIVKKTVPNKKMLIIYQPALKDIFEIVRNQHIAAVSDLEFARELNQESLRQDIVSKIHVEIDSGHGRLGIDPSYASQFAKELSKLSGIVVEGIFMHYSSADTDDEESLSFTEKQTSVFSKAVNDFEQVYGKVQYKHACAGAAIFNPKANHFNMVRPGYLLYGYHPSEMTKNKISLKPSLKLVSSILQIREVDKGTPISYSRRFTTTRKSKIATVAIGYSDGIPRKLFNINNEKNGCFVVNGQRAPIVGTICMDLTMIDITDIKGEVKVGDEVAIFDNVNVTIEEMADICDTIGYEIISQIQGQAERIEVF